MAITMSSTASLETASAPCEATVSSNLSTPKSANVLALLPEDPPEVLFTPKASKPSNRMDVGSMLPPPVSATSIFAPTP